MKKLTLINLTVICLLLGGGYYFVFHKNQKPKTADIFAGQAHYLNKNQIAKLSKKAKEGDGESAFQLYRFYSEVEDNKRDTAQYWLKIGAAHGDEKCQYSLGVLYEAEGNLADAKQWYKKAAKNGNTTALSDLKRIE